MKGFDACVLAMAPVFRDAGLKRPIHIVLSYDEETTCLGSRDIIARFGKDEPRPAAVIVGEPTMMKVADAHKSVATFRTVVTGHEAHSALPALGANAVAAAADVVSEIGRLARAYEEGPLDPRFTPPYSTLHVGMIRGGTARNILARECVFDWEFRGLPGATTASALAKVQAFVDEVATPRLTRFVSGPSIVTTIEVDVPPLAADAGSAAETLALKLTRSNSAIAVSFATEAGHFQGAGLPTIVCGPGSIDMAHKPTNSSTRRSSSPAWNSSNASPRTCRADIRARFCLPQPVDPGRFDRRRESQRSRPWVGVGTVRILALIYRRLAVFALGAFSVWLIVFVFRFTDLRLPTILALSLVYALAAYVILPRIVRMSLKILQRKSVPSFTVTGDGFPGDPVNLVLMGEFRQTARRLSRGGLDRSGAAQSGQLLADGRRLRAQSVLSRRALQHALSVRARPGRWLPEGDRHEPAQAPSRPLLGAEPGAE